MPQTTRANFETVNRSIPTQGSAEDHAIQAAPVNAVAFVHLDDNDLTALAPFAMCIVLQDGETAFRAGDAELDLFIVKSGQLDIINPADGDQLVVSHGPGAFAGDIDLMTCRPAIVSAIARGETKLLKVPGDRLREILNRLPLLGEKMLLAIQERRRLLSLSSKFGLQVVGPGSCRDTATVREFLYKNFVPFGWHDSASDEGKRLLGEWGSPRKMPAIKLSDNQILSNPTLRELATSAGVWRHCPNHEVDLAIVGAGPAGMAAAVYAASEGLSTLVLDRLGPGGQAGGSSKIENFIGFPSGLSGMELATRSVLQMLKFGATMVAPTTVERIDPRESSANPSSEFHQLHLDCGATIRARAILVAAGVRWRRLEAKNAERFDRAGIFYACTSVEAVLYDSKDVAVVGAGNSAGQAAMFLAGCCRNRRVHLLVRRTLGPGMSEYLVGRIRNTENIIVHERVEIDSVGGESRLTSFTLRNRPSDESSVATVQSEAIPAAAIFVFIGAEPGCSWLPDNIARDNLGYILTGADAVKSGRWPLADREPCPLETTIPGILAAGDIRAGSTKRVGFAVGDGSLAVTCVHKLIAGIGVGR